MTSADLLVDGFERIRESVHSAADGLSADQLAYRADSAANPVAWLLWHLTRVQDDHICELAGTEQVWTAQRWHERFDLPLPVDDTGFGHTAEEVAAVRVPDPEPLLGYHDAVHEHTTAFVRGITDSELPRVVDESWDPPTTLGGRLVSVLTDGMQHVGQAEFVRGMIGRGAK
ncbi:mycothiol transferase [Bounagaea algeriensis]